MKKIVALVLALMLALSMLTVATAETANPVAGKKVAYIMLLPSATIFQMWKDSCADLCAVADGLDAVLDRAGVCVLAPRAELERCSLDEISAL